MVLLSAVIVLMFFSVKHAFVISTIGSNVTTNITVPQNVKTDVGLKGCRLLFEIDLHTSKVTIYNENRTSIVYTSSKGRVYESDPMSIVSVQSGGNVQFILHNITEEDAGNYVCLDALKYPIPDCGEWLIVTLNPTTPVIQKKSMPIEDGSLTLRCNTSSRSLPENHNLAMMFTWKRNDETTGINGSDIRVDRSDNGDNFSCQAEEVHGLKSEWSGPFMLSLESDDDANARENDGLKEKGDDEGVLSVIDVKVLLTVVLTILAVVIVISVSFGVKYKKMKEKSRRERYAAYLTPLGNRKSGERNANDDNNGYATIKDDSDGYATIKDDNNGFVIINDDSNG